MLLPSNTNFTLSSSSSLPQTPSSLTPLPPISNFTLPSFSATSFSTSIFNQNNLVDQVLGQTGELDISLDLDYGFSFPQNFFLADAEDASNDSGPEKTSEFGEGFESPER